MRSECSTSVSLCKRKRHHRKLIYQMGRSQVSIFVIQSETTSNKACKKREESSAFLSSFLADLSGPLQLHLGSIDKVVPASFSESLYQQLRVAGQPADLYLYPQGDHNIRVGFDEAKQRTLRCFEARLKSGREST